MHLVDFPFEWFYPGYELFGSKRICISVPWTLSESAESTCKSADIRCIYMQVFIEEDTISKP